MRPQFFPKDHLYIDAAGKEYVAVTRICQITPRSVDFSALPFKDRVMRAAERGNVRHYEMKEVVDYYNTEKDLEDYEVAFDSTIWIMKNLLANKDYEGWASEEIVWSDEDYTSYAGSIDLVCYQHSTEKWILWDLKTGGHETVDYQLSLYKRAWCKVHGIHPENVELRCIDAKDEKHIKVLKIRTINREWLQNLLEAYATGEKYIEPSMELTGIPKSTLQMLDSYEVAITSLEAELKTLKEKEDFLREELYKAMAEAGVERFSFGSVSATRVDPTTATTLDSKKLKEERPEIYEAYAKTSARKGYVKLTVKDITEVAE